MILSSARLAPLVPRSGTLPDEVSENPFRFDIGPDTVFIHHSFASIYRRHSLVSRHQSDEEYLRWHPILLRPKSSSDNRAGLKCNNQSMAGTKIPAGSPRGLLGRVDRTTPAASGRRRPQPARSTSSQDAWDRCRCKQEAGRERAWPEKCENSGTLCGNALRGELRTDGRAPRTTERVSRSRLGLGKRSERSALHPSVAWRCAPRAERR